MRTISRNTSHATFFCVAPNAMRIPISRVRCATIYAITPYSPIAASSAASSPKHNEKNVSSRSENAISSTCWSKVFMSNTGRFASALCTVFLKVAARATGSRFVRT